MYELEKYKNIRQKKSCPACEKRSFVQYIDDETGEYLNDRVGRCDREESCGYHYTPKDYFTDNPQDKKEWKPERQIRRKQPETKPIGYVPLKYIFDSAERPDSTFLEFLFLLFDVSTTKKAAAPYFLGATKNRAAIFPQIDEHGKCRTAKIQKYNPETGKRIKNEPGSINWVHSILKKKGELPEDFNLDMCLFGMHLIRSEKNKGKSVCICESEKSAIIAAGAMPNVLWMASGALGWLNVGKMKPLRGRSILLFPDTSANGIAFDRWSNIAAEARSLGMDVNVSTLLEDGCTAKEKAEGYDIGDYLIDRLKTPTKEAPKKQLSKAEIALISMQEKNPALTLLIDKLDLTLVQ